MTLFDIFYQHTEWWCNPDLGHDTQGKYGDVLKEMEDCALDYARSIKDTGDRWKRVIENETRELCLPNHYSWNLRGDKKEWHDTVVRDFLIRIRKAIEHCYGYNFTELPKSILPSYGIYCDEWPTKRKPQQKHTEAPQQPIGGNSGELAGNGNENAPEGENVPPIENYIELTPELQTTDKKAEKVFTAAYNEGWITKRNDGGYQWKGFGEISRTRKLAYLCAQIYETPSWKDIESFFLEEQLGRDWGNVKGRIQPDGTGRQTWMNRIDNLIAKALQ